MTPVAEAGGVPYGTQIHRVAEEQGDRTAMIFAAEDGSERTVSFEELDRRSTQLAHVLAGRGVQVGEYMAVSLRNSPEHLMACFAGWKVGAVVIPMRWDLPEWERGRVLATINPRMLVDADHADLFDESLAASSEPLEEVIAPRGWGVCSSGSTGTPKAIVMNSPGLYIPGSPTSTVVESYGPLPKPQRVLVPAPLYHSNGFTATRNLMGGDQIVLLERFNAARILDLIEQPPDHRLHRRHPMLQRLAQVPDIDDRDLSSHAVGATGRVGASGVVGPTVVRTGGPRAVLHELWRIGDARRGRLPGGRVAGAPRHPRPWLHRHRDPDPRRRRAAEVPPGRDGQHLHADRRPARPRHYVGDDVAPMPRTEDGFVTVGDLGWVDDEGFLYMADRRSDMIVTGAVNVFPAEVEAALSEHPGHRRRGGHRPARSGVGPPGPRHRPAGRPAPILRRPKTSSCSPRPGWLRTRCPRRSSSSTSSRAAKP